MKEIIVEGNILAAVEPSSTSLFTEKSEFLVPRHAGAGNPPEAGAHPARIHHVKHSSRFISPSIPRPAAGRRQSHCPPGMPA